jgi:hypothetical protein
MNIVRKTATTLGGIFFAVLLIAALAPKATRGIAAALVEVTNTASNAVPTEDGPGNFPFAASTCNALSGCSQGQAQSFDVPLTTSTGLPVKRLVIEDVSAQCTIASGDSVWVAVTVPFSADNVQLGHTGIVQYDFPATLTSATNAVVHQTTRIYADPGASVSTYIVATGLSGLGTADVCFFTLVGHLETK